MFIVTYRDNATPKYTPAPLYRGPSLGIALVIARHFATLAGNGKVEEMTYSSHPYGKVTRIDSGSLRVDVEVV